MDYNGYLFMSIGERKIQYWHREKKYKIEQRKKKTGRKSEVNKRTFT